MLTSFRCHAVAHGRQGHNAVNTFGLMTARAFATDGPATRTNRKPPGPPEQKSQHRPGTTAYLLEDFENTYGGGMMTRPLDDYIEGYKDLHKTKSKFNNKPEPVDFNLLRGVFDKEGVPQPKTNMSSVENLLLQADWVSAVRDSAVARKMSERGEQLKKKKAVEAARANASKAEQDQREAEARKLSEEETARLEEQAKNDQKLFDSKVFGLLSSFDMALINVSLSEH
jgi:ribosomal protein L14E/L6E/L27E